jgi:uncharacterized phage protein (TIGR01671 family)
MKREIKFRAWIPNTGWLAEGFSIAMDGTEWYDDNGHSWPVCDLEIMQFTGLKDKNGKEIYEGDIVHIEYFKMAVGENLGVYETEAELTGVVEFDGLSLILQNIVGEKWQEYTGHDAGEGKCKFMYLGDVYEGSLDASYQMEIIGNIYENAELLNK